MRKLLHATTRNKKAPIYGALLRNSGGFCKLLKPPEMTCSNQTLNRKFSTSPSLTMYSLPSARILPASLAPDSPL